MSEDHIDQVTKLFGEFVEEQLATVFDAEGREVGRQVLTGNAASPQAPEGGSVRLAPLSRIFKNEDFGYRTVTVERPLRDEKGEVVLASKGKLKGQPQPNTELRDTE